MDLATKKLILTFTALAILLLFVQSGNCDGANAQPILDATIEVERNELALALAKVCVNEGGWHSVGDCNLIWQATRSHGRTDAQRLRWLQRHSWTVLGDVPPEETGRRVLGNAIWTWRLQASDARPATFPADLNWEGQYVRYWRSVRAHAHGLVRGRVPASGWPCPETPHTWGGDMDSHHAQQRGMRALDCRRPDGRPTLNTGYRWRSRD